VKLRQLEDENTRMQRIIARQTLEIDAMRSLGQSLPGGSQSPLA
jgi:hypothetical protein